MDQKKQILEATRIRQILRRMAYQIYEANFNEKELVLVGIGKQGMDLGKRIIKELAAIDASFIVSPFLLDLDKSDPNGTVELKAAAEDLSGKSVVLVDDVLNTGRTLAYSLMAVLEHTPKKIELAVLVDRGHRKYPLSATYAGYALATTLEEHIEVTLGKSPAVYLY